MRKINNKKKSVLIIGFGSIGEKHAMILKKFFNFYNIFILTKRKTKKYFTIRKLNDIKKFDFDYIIISSNTSKHFTHIKYIEKNFNNKKILVEKPLFNKFQKIKIKKNKVFVGYNLRFHPLIQYLKTNLERSKIFNIKVICNSYLPDWRKNINFKKSSSSNKSKGGGVILDLSHEIDYIRWIFGKISLKFVKRGRISKITKNTEDYLYLNGKVKKTNLSLDLNYFSRIPKRLIFIDAKDFAVSLDLISNSYIIKYKNKTLKKNLRNFNNNFTYLQQHKAILNNDYNTVCDLKFANDTMKLIDKIKNWQN